MGSSYNTIIKVKEKIIIKDLKDELIKKGFKLNEIDGICDIEYNEENSILIISTPSISTFGEIENGNITLEKNIIELWQKIIANILDIINENIAIDSLEFSIYGSNNKLETKFQRLLGIYYREFDEILPYLNNMIKESGKELSEKEIKQIVDDATTHEQIINKITCKSFLFVHPELNVIDFGKLAYILAVKINGEKDLK